MSFSREIAGAISELEVANLPGHFDPQQSCAGAKFHSPRPLLLHKVVLSDDRTAQLCGVCRDNLRVLNELVNASDGELPWRVRREFGNQLRSLTLMTPEETENG